MTLSLVAACRGILNENAHKDDCNLEGFKGAVLDVSGIVIFDQKLVIDRDPKQWPTLKCSGQLVTDTEGRRRMAGRNTTITDEERRQRNAARRKGARMTKRQARQRSPATGAEPVPASTMGYESHRDHDENHYHGEYESTTTPKTYYRGPGSIFSGVVYAHDPHGKGQIGTGTFKYVQPAYVPSDVADEDLVNFGFEILTSAPGKVYTPFQYDLKLTRSSNPKQQAYPPYSSRRKG